MDGNKYAKDVINNLTILSNSDQLELKRTSCVLINGCSSTANESLRWNRSYDPNILDIILKPQYFHSAASIYLLIKYPHLRKSDSFIHIIINSGLEEVCMKIACDVLNNDIDGVSFINNADYVFNNLDVVIIDDLNHKILK